MWDEEVLQQFESTDQQWPVVLLRLTGPVSGTNFVVFWTNGLPDDIRERHQLRENTRAFAFEELGEAQELFDAITSDLDSMSAS